MTDTDNYICVIGSSAGGINALKKLFTSFSSFPHNIAFIVAQHLSPGAESHLAKILSAGITVPVVTANSVDIIQPGTVYIAPPDKNITAINGKIILKPANTLYKPSIDALFISAASAYGKKAIGVILTGSGKDGAKGVAEIKKHGGYTIVQEPSNAEYDSMPLEAIRTHSIDAIVECAKIPALVLGYAGNNNLNGVLKQNERNKTPLKQIFSLLLRYSGTDFNAYKPPAVQRRMQLRMGQVHCASIEEYLAYINKNPQETGFLYQHLLIGVTEFFRDKEAFGQMQKKLAELLEQKKDNSHMRLWSAACSTGEEAYTLAIILCEILGEKIHQHNIKVYASDIDETALAFARKGIYNAEQVKSLPPGLLQKYFTKSGESYVITKQVRSLIVFHKHDITSDPPFVQLELICCRNMLIYFNQQAQNRIFSFFHYALKEGGILFLGKSETISRHKDIFSPISIKYCLYKKNISPTNKHPLLKSKAAKETAQISPNYEGTLTDLLKDGFYKMYPHAFAVINEKYDVQHIHGDMLRFMRMPQGDITLNILKMVRTELQIELRAILHKCLKENMPVYGHAKHVLLDKEHLYMRVAVWPLATADGLAKFFVVAFEVPDISAFAHLLATADKTTRKNSRTIELEKELQQTKEHLQAFIDQLEAANGQLQLLNEELHTTNEELQVANEELEANNEEQQEANEQITDSYSQLKNLHVLLEEKEAVLRLTSSTLQTVLDNAMEGYLLIGNNYVLTAFNQVADTFFGKINNTTLQIGESMFRFVPLDLIKGFKQRYDEAWAGETSTHQVKHIINGEPMWLQVRYAPVYGHNKTVENVLLSFLDITNEVVAQQKVDASELLFRSMIENSTDIIFRKDVDGRILYISPSVQRIAGYEQQQLIGRNLLQFVHDGDVAAVTALHKNVVKSIAAPAAVAFRFKHADGRILWVEGTAVNMLEMPGVASIIVNIRDVTMRKQAEQKLVASEVRFRSLIENSNDGIALLNADHKLIYLSNAITRITGYTNSELTGFKGGVIAYPDDVHILTSMLKSLDGQFDKIITGEYRIKHKNGELRWIKVNIANQLNQEHINAFVINFEDITDRKKAEELLKESERMMAEAQKLGRFGSWELDVTEDGFGHVRWSDEVFRIYGYAPRSIEVSLEKASAAIPLEDHEIMNPIFEKAFKEKSRYFFDHRVVRPDGTICWVHEDAQFVKDEATGKALKIVGTIQDITERKKAEDRLLKSEANMRAIFDNTEIAYIMLDENLNIVTFNPQAAKWVNTIYQKTLCAGAWYATYIKNPTDAARFKVLSKRVLGGKLIKFDYHSLTKEGVDEWSLIRLNPIVGNREKIHGICMSISDITLRKQHEIEREKITNDLIQRNKGLEQFTYVVSHNLRAPLTNIIGLSKLMMEDEQDEALQQQYKKQLSVSAEKMDVIIKDLHEVLQIKKDINEVKQTVYFSELVRDITMSIQLVMLQQNVAMTTDFTAVNEFLTIKSYMYSIFYNLIINSVKYRVPGAATLIEIKSFKTPGKLQLVFKDNGLGIDLTRRGKEIFGLYKRFHFHVEGKGMGLFMVKTQAEALGGTVSVESEINKGTAFTISFPA